jgi:hypothetical protein
MSGFLYPTNSNAAATSLQASVPPIVTYIKSGTGPDAGTLVGLSRNSATLESISFNYSPTFYRYQKSDAFGNLYQTVLDNSGFRAIATNNIGNQGFVDVNPLDTRLSSFDPTTGAQGLFRVDASNRRIQCLLSGSFGSVGYTINSFGVSWSLPTGSSISSNTSIVSSDAGKSCAINNRVNAGSVNANIEYEAGISSTASSGGATLPAQPAGFIDVVINGSFVKIPYYNP